MPAEFHRRLPKLLSKRKICLTIQECKGEKIMKKYVCVVCGYVYEGEELPEDYECPLCGVGPDQFEEEAE